MAYLFWKYHSSRLHSLPGQRAPGPWSTQQEGLSPFTPLTSMPGVPRVLLHSTGLCSRGPPPPPHACTKLHISSGWRKAGEGAQSNAHPILSVWAQPLLQQRPLGRVCRVVAPPRALCWHCKPSPENRKVGAKPATLRAEDTTGLSLPPFHFPRFNPGHLYLKGWDYGRDRMTSLSLPAAEREKSVSVVCACAGGW